MKTSCLDAPYYSIRELSTSQQGHKHQKVFCLSGVINLPIASIKAIPCYCSALENLNERNIESN